MGKSESAGAYVSPNQVLYGTPSESFTFGPWNNTITSQGSPGLPGGAEAFNFASELLKNGLPKDLRDRLEKRFQGNLGGQIRSGEQSLRENFAGQGGPVGSLNSGLVSLQSNANDSLTDFYTNMAQEDFGARQQGFGNLQSLQGMLLGGAANQSQYDLGKYQIDRENEFNWGEVLGGALNAGASAYNPAKTFFLLYSFIW